MVIEGHYFKKLSDYFEYIENIALCCKKMSRFFKRDI
jgi:hypothetical protein